MVLDLKAVSELIVDLTTARAAGEVQVVEGFAAAAAIGVAVVV